MTAHLLITRRILLRDMGKAGLAMMVLGTAACADPDEGAASTEQPGTTSGPGPATSQSDAPTTTSPGTTASGDVTSGHEWHRVDLGFVSAYILYRGGEAAVVDTGVEGSEGAIETALAEIGLGWDSVGHLVVTHRHPDHQGSVDAVITASDAPWYAGRGDLDAITAASPGSAVGDGDSVFGLTIIETPGHTPGHISVLDESSGVLVAGDALNGADGGVAGPNPEFSEDMAAANASVARLAEFDFEVALFGHGEPVLSGASGQVASLAGREDS